jgi:hypothetical protein
LKYYLEFQEYPCTSETGTASVYNLSGWNPSEAKETFKLHNIQYAIGNPGKIWEIFCHFLGVQCKVEQRTCKGVKMCKLADPVLLENKHSYVNFEDDTNKKIFEARELSSREFTLW